MYSTRTNLNFTRFTELPRSFQRRGSNKRVEFPSHPNLLQQHLRNNHLAAAAMQGQTQQGGTDDSSLGSFNLESNTEHDADIDEEYR